MCGGGDECVCISVYMYVQVGGVCGVGRKYETNLGKFFLYPACSNLVIVYTPVHVRACG